MDMGLVRGLITVLVFVLFVAIAAWAYSKKRRERFDQLAEMPLKEDVRVSDLTDANNNSEEKGR